MSFAGVTLPPTRTRCGRAGRRGRRALAAHHDGFVHVSQIHGDVEAKRMLAVYLEPANRGREPACINFQPVHPIGERAQWRIARLDPWR